MKSPGPSPARRTALAAVCNSLGPSGYDLQAALGDALGRAKLDPRDVALATELAYGYCRLKGRADFILAGFLRDPAGLPFEAKITLGIAAFELAFLDKSPAHAVVNWAVGAVKERFGQGLAKVANAVLRKAADLGPRPRDEKFYRDRAKNEAAFLEAWYSCPRWIVAALRRDLDDARAFEILAAQVKRPPLGLRVNAAKPEAEAVHAELAASAPHYGEFPALAVSARDAQAIPAGRIAELEAGGVLSRQSVAAQDILAALGPATWPGPVFDVCAGRGGKTCLLLEAGLPVAMASDLSRHRQRGLSRELARLNLPRIPRVVCRAEDILPFRLTPGTILIDAPCTGLGVLARRPDAKWKRTPADASVLAKLQTAMLARAFDSIKSGGKIAYITCTPLAAENQRQIEALSSANPGAKILRQTETENVAELGEFFFGALVEKG